MSTSIINRLFRPAISYRCVLTSTHRLQPIIYNNVNTICSRNFHGSSIYYAKYKLNNNPKSKHKINKSKSKTPASFNNDEATDELSDYDVIPDNDEYADGYDEYKPNEPQLNSQHFRSSNKARKNNKKDNKHKIDDDNDFDDEFIEENEYNGNKNDNDNEISSVEKYDPTVSGPRSYEEAMKLGLEWHGRGGTLSKYHNPDLKYQLRQQTKKSNTITKSNTTDNTKPLKKKAFTSIGELLEKHNIVPDLIRRLPEQVKLCRIVFNHTETKHSSNNKKTRTKQTQYKISFAHNFSPKFAQNKPLITYGKYWEENNENDTKGDSNDKSAKAHETTKPELFTLVMVDADAKNHLGTKTSKLHWLVMNIPKCNIESGNTVAIYQGPRPKQNTGLHRYTIFIFQQSDHIDYKQFQQSAYNNKAVDSINAEENPRIGFDLNKFLRELKDKDEKYKLTLYACNMFRSVFDFSIKEDEYKPGKQAGINKLLSQLNNNSDSNDNTSEPIQPKNRQEKRALEKAIKQNTNQNQVNDTNIEEEIKPKKIHKPSSSNNSNTSKVKPKSKAAGAKHNN